MATKKLSEMQANAKMGKVLDSAKRDTNQRFALKDLLNVPMQRLLKCVVFPSFFFSWLC